MNLVENLTQNSEYLSEGIIIILIGFLSFVGYRYWKLNKKYGGKIPDE